MALSNCTHSAKGSQAPLAPKSGLGFLAALLDGLDDGPILVALQAYRRTGRPGYPLRAMWRAYLLKFVLNIRYNNQLLERLRGSRKLRGICGFGDAVPSESALSRFVDRLADHQDLVEQCLNALTGEVRELAPTVKPGKKGKPDQPLPPLGEVLAIDSTLFLTYSNPNRRVVSDSDARWGVKHSAKAKEGGTEWGFGYEKHLVSDATHGVPLAFIITPANVGDLYATAHCGPEGPGHPPLASTQVPAGRPRVRQPGQPQVPAEAGHYAGHSHTEAHRKGRAARWHLHGVGRAYLHGQGANGTTFARTRKPATIYSGAGPKVAP